MASKRRNMFHKNKTEETTENGYPGLNGSDNGDDNAEPTFKNGQEPELCQQKRRAIVEPAGLPTHGARNRCATYGPIESAIRAPARSITKPIIVLRKSALLGAIIETDLRLCVCIMNRGGKRLSVPQATCCPLTECLPPCPLEEFSTPWVDIIGAIDFSANVEGRCRLPMLRVTRGPKDREPNSPLWDNGTQSVLVSYIREAFEVSLQFAR
ncbi:hypothetical protein AAG570_008517 [Ranatra chinensis]|uniref:Uncharacterized protein n=1 Tax=Ranatra chinensis TaxID=642074 RepID=A0ABD0YR39_9HEMI